jgi:5-methylcytosine-specific restriction endonuclease McrA
MKVIPFRPKCNVKGCKSFGHNTGNKRKDGSIIYRKVCVQHHIKKLAENQGISVTEWTNARHPYRKYRKEYCENRDGRFGFKCRYKIRFSGQLQVDHINGKPNDNREKNLQTLCANCHIFKTNLFGDAKTPGRKYFKNAA